MGKKIISVAAIFMVLAVIIGAFGAHALENEFTADRMQTYNTGVEYHFYHALGLLLVGIIAFHSSSKQIMWSAILLGLGIFIFSGSLYVLAVTDIRWMGAITPIGGVSFIAGWIFLLLAMLRK